MRLRPHNITSGKYFSILVRRYIKQTWWAYALPAIALIGVSLCLNDVRFVFLTLIYVFLVCPMVVFLALFSYGLASEVRYSILRKSITADDDGLEFQFIDDDDAGIDVEIVEWTRLRHISTTNEELLLLLANGKFKFIAIPVSVFDGQAELLQFIGLAKNAGVDIH